MEGPSRVPARAISGNHAVDAPRPAGTDRLPPHRRHHRARNARRHRHLHLRLRQGRCIPVQQSRACANCHVMQDHFNSWQNSSHKNVATCNDCHLSHHPIGKWIVKADNGFFHSLAFTTGDFPDPIRIKQRNRRVTQHACLLLPRRLRPQHAPRASGGRHAQLRPLPQRCRPRPSITSSARLAADRHNGKPHEHDNHLCDTSAPTPE
jgi:cytochrome c nitrite reductase small subunit